MFNISIPKHWIIENGRLVLRLVDRKTRKTKSIALTQGVALRLSSTDLPNSKSGEVVAWVDVVGDNGTSPITERINLGSINRLKGLRPIIYTKRLTTTQKIELDSFIKIANAWRWVQPQDDRDAFALSHGIIHGLSVIDNSTNGPINRLLTVFNGTYSINDGTEISNQIVYIWSLCKLLVVGNEKLGADGFNTRRGKDSKETAISVKVATELMIEFKEFSQLPAPLAVAASLETIVSGRAHAENSYEKLIKESGVRIQKTGALAGVQSYGDLSKKQSIVLPELKFVEIGAPLDSRANLGRTTVLYSANPAFLRAYLMRLVYHIGLFPEYDYHLHIVGDEQECTDLARCVLETYQLNQSIRGESSDSSHITFSSSTVPPNIPEKVSYYASARFFFASHIVKVTGSPVWIQDVDLYPTGDTLKYLDELNKHDVSLFFSNFLHGAFPWIRYLAGNVYVNNTINGMRFLNHACAYLSEWITVQESWTVDQNALAFAVESSGPELDLADVRRMRIPLQQSDLASRIERD